MEPAAKQPTRETYVPTIEERVEAMERVMRFAESRHYRLTEEIRTDRIVNMCCYGYCLVLIFVVGRQVGGLRGKINATVS